MRPICLQIWLWCADYTFGYSNKDASSAFALPVYAMDVEAAAEYIWVDAVNT